MDYANNIFKRMSLHQLSAFLLYGAEGIDTETASYKERLKKGIKSIYKRLENIYQDEVELDKAVADLSEALTSYEAVYTEIGMRFGAKIIHQLLHNYDHIEFDTNKEKLKNL